MRKAAQSKARHEEIAPLIARVKRTKKAAAAAVAVDLLFGVFVRSFAH